MNETYLKAIAFLEELLRKNPAIYEHFGKNYAYMPTVYFTMPVISDITQKLASDLNEGNTYITDTVVRLYMFLGRTGFESLYCDIDKLLTTFTTDAILPEMHLERIELFNTEDTFNTISATMITLFCLEQALNNINTSDK